MKHFGYMLTLLAGFGLTIGCGEAADKAKEAEPAEAEVKPEAENAEETASDNAEQKAAPAEETAETPDTEEAGADAPADKAKDTE